MAHDMRSSANIVSPEWLKSHLNDTDIVVLDASMHNPLPGKSVEAAAETIPGALRFDFERDICDTQTALPNMLPSTEQFETQVRSLGINSDTHVVVFDNIGVYSSPRAWWMFKVMGHEKVSVLNGGLIAWRQAGGDVEPVTQLSAHSGQFIAKKSGFRMVSAVEVLDNLENAHAVVVDARSAARFTGKEKDPRPNVRAGHIPESLNLHYASLIHEGEMIAPAQLRSRFDALALQPDEPVIFSCGSGVTACILALAALELGFSQIAVYDGSWSEWGASHAFPVEVSD